MPLWNKAPRPPVRADRKDRLLVSLFLYYLAALLAGSVLITVNNLTIAGSTLAKLWDFNIKAVLAGDMLIALVLLAISSWRLRPVIQYLQDRSSEARRKVVFERLQRFPSEIFRGMMLLTVVFSLLYHAAEYRHLKGQWVTWRILLNYLKPFMVEIGLGLTISVLLHSVLRRMLRPYILQLNVTEIEETGGQSGMFAWMATYVCCFAIAALNLYRYFQEDKHLGPGFEASDIYLLAGAYSIFAAAILTMRLMESREDLYILIDGMESLQRADKKSMHRPVPVVSRDETGRLTSAFNRLQGQVLQAYEELDAQLKLAYTIQQKLLPVRLPAAEQVEMAAICRQSLEVGGDFYDVADLGDGRYAIAIGDVTGKGMSAAILMSAMMVLLQNEIAGNDTAADMLKRLNRVVYESTRGGMFVTMGLALLDVRQGRLEYASAGHLAPYIVSGGKATELACSSLPLGIDPDVEYTGTVAVLKPGDSLVMYSDGVIEAKDEDGEGMLSFDKWERMLCEGITGAPLQEELEILGRRLVGSDQTELHDDFTLILIRWNGMEQHGSCPFVRSL